MNKEQFKQYEELKLQEKEIKEKIKKLAPIILSQMSEDDDIKTDRGTFLVQNRAMWKFSKLVERNEISLKEMKDEEKANGVAEKTDNLILVYKEDKKEK